MSLWLDPRYSVTGLHTSKEIVQVLTVGLVVVSCTLFYGSI